MQVAVNLFRVQELYGGDFAGVLDVARCADALGVDQVTAADHVGLTGGPGGVATYPRDGGFTLPLDTPYYEPLTMLAAVAAVTRRIRLSSNIMIAPLRPAVFFAKQLATLDQISHGRVDAAFGAGWQRSEFEASGLIRFEDRFRYMDEQIAACRALWAAAPAEYTGSLVRFADFYSLPQPVQRPGIPIWLGVTASPRHVARMARLADGWAAPPVDPATLQAGTQALHAALRAAGRDTGGFPIRMTLRVVRQAGSAPDWEASLAMAAAYAAAGASMLALNLMDFCRTAAEIEPFIRRAVQLQAL